MKSILLICVLTLVIFAYAKEDSLTVDDSLEMGSEERDENEFAIPSMQV